MNTGRYILVFLAISIIATTSIAQSHIRFPPHTQPTVLRSRTDENLYCDSWRFTVETNDAGSWSRIPTKCQNFVKEYMTGEHYRSDSEVAVDYALSYAKTVEFSGDGKDAWVFDIDETLLSNLPYYVEHGFGSEIFDEKSFDEWVNLANVPALPASLRLYNELEQLGFTIFLLTGRGEYQRNVTDKNLLSVGYSNYERLILRGPADKGTLATNYKSKKRRELEEEGYRIHGSSGDQWSDLNGGPADKGTFATNYKSKKRCELEEEGYRSHGSSRDQWSDLNGYTVL